MAGSSNTYGGSTFSFMWSAAALPALRALRALGLDGFDVLTAPGHLWHGDCTGTERAELAATLRRDGIRIDTLNLPALDHNLASCVPDVRAFSIELYVNVMRFAADLGGRGIVVVPGRVSPLWPPPQNDSRRWLRDSLDCLLGHAKSLDQVVIIESHPQTPIPRAADMLEIVRYLANDRLQIAYDVSNAEFIAEDQPDAIHLLGRHIGQVHLSDGTRSSWRHDGVGRGTVNFAGVLGALDAIGYRGPRILEIISPDPLGDYAASIAALEPHAPSSRPS